MGIFTQGMVTAAEMVTDPENGHWLSTMHNGLLVRHIRTAAKAGTLEDTAMSTVRRSTTRSAFGAPVATLKALAEQEEEEALVGVQSAIKRFRRTPSVANTRARTPMTADPRYRRTSDKETPAKRKRSAADSTAASASRTSSSTVSRGLKRQRIASNGSAATPLAASAVSRSRTAAKEELQSAKEKLHSAQLLAKIRTLEAQVSELTQEQQSAATAAAAAKRHAAVRSLSRSLSLALSDSLSLPLPLPLCLLSCLCLCLTLLLSLSPSLSRLYTPRPSYTAIFWLSQPSDCLS